MLNVTFYAGVLCLYFAIWAANVAVATQFFWTGFLTLALTFFICAAYDEAPK